MWVGTSRELCSRIRVHRCTSYMHGQPTAEIVPQVSGEVDAVFAMGGGPEVRRKVLQEAEADARAKAVAAGADPSSCEVTSPYRIVDLCECHVG